MIVIVSGLPRAGTSMVMQMLAAGGRAILADDTRPADAGNPRGYLEYAPVKALGRDSSWMAEAEGKAVKIVAPLLIHLPASFDYRVILISRDLDEVLASQAQLLRTLGRNGGDPAVLKPVFTQQLDRARLWLQRRKIPFLEVAYAEIIAYPRHCAESIASFLAIDLDEEAMAAVVDPQLHRQRTS